MAAPFPSKPTAAELEILRILWDHGPSTVRDVHAVLAQRKPTGYTTVLKLLQIMAGKRMVNRNEESRAHIYEARQPAESTKRQLVGDLLQRAFAGSTSQLMLHALAGEETSREELDEIRLMLDQYERTKK